MDSTFSLHGRQSLQKPRSAMMLCTMCYEPGRFEGQMNRQHDDVAIVQWAHNVKGCSLISLVFSAESELASGGLVEQCAVKGPLLLSVCWVYPLPALVFVICKLRSAYVPFIRASPLFLLDSCEFTRCSVCALTIRLLNSSRICLVSVEIEPLLSLVSAGKDF
ncbi:hypothetical protein AXF42_Ash020540 [Apostasia shenzhenica]|uniref:Uncharacterized protein n=1 Tax=Apostasia shenzhenica TaxID=1088818 RepID=A0A2I0BCU9_9ASPA|nr:hypothetical protein AXF42_Ash020540 [Apostasia shenzhenica]